MYIYYIYLNILISPNSEKYISLIPRLGRFELDQEEGTEEDPLVQLHITALVDPRLVHAQWWTDHLVIRGHSADLMVYQTDFKTFLVVLDWHGWYSI